MSDENMSNITTALILAGGKGTRLRSVISDRPKVLSEVCGRPFVTYLLDQLIAAGFRRIVLSTGYMAETVSRALGNTYRSADLVYSRELQPLGTGGGIRHSLPLLQGDSVLVMNGDSFVDVDLKSYTAWFSQRPREASLLLVKVRDTNRYGQVAINGEDRLTSFVEKKDAYGPGWINGGIYILSMAIVNTIPSGVPCSLEREVFPGLVGSGDFFGFRCRGAFIDIGTPESFEIADRFMSGCTQYSNSKAPNSALGI